MASNQPGNGFTIVNNTIFEDDNLTVIERHALIVLIRFYRSDIGYSYPSYSSLKRYLNVKDNSSVASTLKSLEVKGYITRQSITGVGTRYFINKHLFNNDDTHEDTVVGMTNWKKTTSGKKATSSKEATKPVVNSQPDQLYKSNTINTITNTKINTSELDSFFEQIWRAYPKKEGKGKVSRTQKGKLCKIGFDEINRAIERYKKAKHGVDKQFIMNGSTFLNGGYIDYLDNNWQEEIPESSLKEVKAEW